MRSEFARFLRRSFHCLEREAPAAWKRLVDRLHGRSLRLTVDGDAVVLTPDGRGLRLSERPGAAEAELTTSKATILALVDGRTSLAQALLDDRLDVRGPVDAALAFDDAFRLYLEGAVRSPSLPALLRAYRGDPPETGWTHPPDAPTRGRP